MSRRLFECQPGVMAFHELLHFSMAHPTSEVHSNISMLPFKPASRPFFFILPGGTDTDWQIRLSEDIGRYAASNAIYLLQLPSSSRQFPATAGSH